MFEERLSIVLALNHIPDIYNIYIDITKEDIYKTKEDISDSFFKFKIERDDENDYLKYNAKLYTVISAAYVDYFGLNYKYLLIKLTPINKKYLKKEVFTLRKALNFDQSYLKRTVINGHDIVIY